MNAIPKVSVLIPTYNHESYIAQAVTSALQQQADFPFEVVVGEDCSTDGTRKILLELQQAFPQTLRLLLHEQNIGGQCNVAAIFAACRGEYVAMLEGDDYWTHPLKLQKQIDLLDAHPEWSICFHATQVVYEDGSKPPHVYPHNWTKEVSTVEDLFSGNFMSTCSVVFRNHLFGPIPAWHRELVPGDWVLHILNADRGDIGYLNEVMADYRIHSRGLWSSKDRAARQMETLRMLSAVDRHFGGKYARQIDEYRIRLVTSLITKLENANRRLERLSKAAIPKPPAPIRSPVYRLGRTVMRPLEQMGRRWRAALGLKPRTAA